MTVTTIMTTTTMITTNNRIEGKKTSGPMLLPQLKTIGATPVARAPYRLAPSEMQELSNQLQELADRDFPVKDYTREVHRVQVFNFGGLPNLMAEELSARMLMEHRDAQGMSSFTSRSWRRLFDIKGPLVHELILEFLRISSTGDFLGTTPSYTSIQDLILRLCHRLIACSIAGRSQAPEKVTVTDLFYLRGMGVSSVNVPYVLARYLRFFAAGRNSGALIFGGEFVAQLAEHFGLLMEERLRGLTVIAPALPVINMAELVRLQICVKIDDTWAWVALGTERQSNAAAGAPGVAQDAPVIGKGDQAVLALLQAPPPPPAAARTMSQRMARLDEDVYKIHGALAEQREVIGSMAKDFSKFTV
ncbi:hypothetical protein Tco_1276206 [Tanacetum coccineum]